MNATEEASFPAMRRRDEETDDDDIVASNDSSIIRETLRLYGSFYLCCFLLYCVLRRRYPLLFNVRSWVPELECELAKREYGLFDWFWKVFGFTDEEIFKDCGMDAMCFLRALRMGRKLSLCGCFCAVWLIPLYATATESSETAYLNNTWDEISVSNLPSSSARFVATVLASYIVFFYSMYLLFHEFKWYTKWRHKFLAKPWSRNYAVYVSGIPLAFRSSSQLAEYFRQCSSKEAVIEAHVAMDTPGLESKVARREFVVRNLEHAVALERKTGGTKTHRRVGFRRGLEKVESVSEYEAELRELNRYIERSIGELILTRDRSRCKLNQNAATFIMTGSQEWIGEDSANDYADFQVLSSVNCMNSEESESETDPLVNVLPAVPREEYIALNMHREEGTMAAVAEDITILYGDDGDYKDTPAVLSMHREKGGISEDDRPGLKELMGTVSVASVSDEKDTLARVFSDPENEIEFGPREVGDDAILFSPDVSSREPPSRADSAWNTRSNASSVSSSSSILPDSESKISRDASQASHSIASSSHEIGQAMKKAVKELKPDKLIQTAHDKGADTIKKAKEVGNIIVATTGAVVPMILTKSEGKSTSAGFVLFSSLYAATSVIQMVHHPKPGAMDVQEAPDPDDIFWKSVGLEQHILRTGRVVSLAASAVLCFFWSVPMAFISSLTEVHSLKETMPALGRWIEDHPRSEAVFEQIAPLLLLFFNTVILPGFLKLFATWEGLISSRMLEASLFVKLGAFMIIQTFFVSAISGGIAGIYGYESRSMYHLARGLYLTLLLSCTILLATTFLMQSLECLRVYPLGMAFLRHYVGPNLTSKERRQTWAGIYSLEEPPGFWHAKSFAQVILYFVVFFVYAPIAPITTFFLYFCFILLESGYRYQFIHNYPRPFDTGGKLWLVFIQFTLACMLISQLTLIGLLALKESFYAGPAMVPLTVITIMFVIFINRKLVQVTKYLPTRDCLIIDRINNESGVVDDPFARGKYLQPALRAVLVEAEYES